jgi:hypothetical protein
MEVYPRESRPAPGVPGRVIAELAGPERPGCLTILYDDGNNWITSDPFPTAPLGQARLLREDMKWVDVADAYRNKLYDGGFEVWQGSRSYVMASVFTDLGCDMWLAYANAPANYTVSRQAGLTTGSQYCIRIQRNILSADTGSVSLDQRTSLTDPGIVYAMRGKRCVLSLTVRCSPTYTGPVANSGNFQVSIYDTGVLIGYAKLLALDAAQRFVIPVSPVSAASTDVTVRIDWGHSGVAGAADYIEFDDVQLETADVATPFERLPFQVEYERAQRFIQKSFPYNTAPAQAAGFAGCLNWFADVAGAGLALTPPIRFAPAMRKIPAMTYYNTTLANAFVYNTALGTSATTTFAANQSESGLTTAFNGLAPWAVGNSIAVSWVADARF